jgi:hypothetical protein
MTAQRQNVELRHPDRAGEEVKVRRLLSAFFHGDEGQVAVWWATRNPLLGDLTPDQLIEARPGKLLKIVKQALAENER